MHGYLNAETIGGYRGGEKEKEREEA